MPDQAAAAASRCPCAPRLEALQQEEWRLEAEELRIHEDVMQLRGQIQAVEARAACQKEVSKGEDSTPLPQAQAS